MQNLELKVRCRDGEELASLIERAQAGGAIYARTLAQRDTYFAAPRGRLKLREWDQPVPPGAGFAEGEDTERAPRGATLIAYARPDDAGSRVSDYLLTPTDDPRGLRAALDRALGTRVVVEKMRVLYLWGQTRIHFDRVTGLGEFVELETLLDRAPGAEAALAEHHAVIAALGLDRLATIAGSYSDLLLTAGG